MNVSKAAIRRLRSRNAQHFDGDTGPMVTIVHNRGVASTTGRLIAETSHELALMVHGSPVVISKRSIVRRTTHVDERNPLPVFSALMAETFGRS